MLNKVCSVASTNNNLKRSAETPSNTCVTNADYTYVTLGFSFQTLNIGFNESKLDGVTFSSDGPNSSVRKSRQLECDNFYGFVQTTHST